jgi:putative acetyltransferase
VSCTAQQILFAVGLHGGQGARVLIRRERPDDIFRIDEVHRLAFAAMAPAGAEPVEVGLVHALRADDGWVPALSLVAEGSDGDVAGHVVATAGSIGSTPAVGLGPVGVPPEHQGRGVGSALMHAVLGAADALDYPFVVLVGHTDYYPRFGFAPAASLRITAPDPSWGEHFQARSLAAAPADGSGGTFRFAAPFEALAG